jgi:hypothetical protein
MIASAYSPRKVDLFYPARGANFFANGLPETEAELCAEMSRLAYCRCEPYFHFDKRQIRSVLDALGFTCQFFESVGTPEGRGTHALLALHDNTELGGQLAVVAFRGTDAADPTDLADDAEFLQTKAPQGGLVHSGFSQALEHVLPDLTRALQQLEGMRLLLTGHSLGAAMATLLSSIRRPDFLYTFGCPRVGDQEFVTTLGDMNNRRFVDCCDIVSRLPPESLLSGITYAHFGIPYYIDRKRNITPNPTADVMEEDRLIAASEYLVDYAWKTGNVGFRELADHAPINYVTAVSADLSQPKLASWRVATKAAS